MPRDSSRETKPWSVEEDTSLLMLQREHGNKWSEIGRAMGTRTGQQCAQRWRHKVNPSIRRERWTEQEDEKLRGLQEKFGSKWAVIAREMGGRTDQQCMGRWRRHLDPEVVREAWTSDEDALLCQLYELHGPKWSLICESIRGRTAQQSRARWFQIDGHNEYIKRVPEIKDDRYSDHEGSVAPPMATLSPTRLSQPFRHILEEVSAHMPGDLEAADTPHESALGRRHRRQAMRASTAMDPMALWRDIGGAVADANADRKRPRETDDKSLLSIKKPRVRHPPLALVPQVRNARTSTSASTDDKLSVLLGVALGRNRGGENAR